MQGDAEADAEHPHAATLFEEPWWLDAVAPDAWSEVTVASGDRVDARLPYVLKRRYGLRIVGLPPLTQHLGPWLRMTAEKPAKRVSQEMNLMEGLIEALPDVDVIDLNLAPIHTNWLPFCWKGFEQTTRYTYRINDLSDLDAVWKEMKSSVRRDVRKAEKVCTVRQGSLDDFLRLQDKTFERQGTEFPYTHETVRRLDRAAAERDCRRILIASDAEGRDHAGAYLVWGHGTAYYLMGGNDPELRESAAMSLVMWAAIRHAAEVTEAFDFEGSMLPHVEPFVRSFGGEQTPYFKVQRFGRKARVLRGLAQMMGK